MVDISDIKASIQNKALIQDAFFKDAEFLKDARGRLLSYTGGYTVVIPSIVNGEKWAFRCWHFPIDDAKKRYALIGRSVRETQLPYFCSFSYSERGLIVKGDSLPITKMRWVEGKNLKSFVCAHYNNSEIIKNLAISFKEMVLNLHQNHIAHGDLQHGNIIVSDSGQLFLVDYDSMYVPFMSNDFADIITGLKDYQHPARKNNKTSSEKLDYFSELVIYLSLIAISEKPSLVDKYQVSDTEALLFKAADYSNLPSSKIYRDLWGLSYQVRLHLLLLESYLREDNINSLSPFTSDSAKNKVEKAYWHNIVLAGGKDKAVVEDFLNLFPSGEYRLPAEMALAEIRENEKRIIEEDRRSWNQALTSQSPSDFRYYINRFPKGERIKEAKQWLKEYLSILDEEEWRKAKKVNTINSYRQYLERPTNERYRTEAQRLVNKLEEDADWSFAAKANTYDAYLAYQRKHPMGDHRTDCTVRLAVYEDDIDWQKAVSSSALSIYEKYVQKHPNGKHLSEAQARIIEFRDDNKWNYAVSLDTIFAYNLYKSDFPQGRHIEECLKRINLLSEEANWKRTVAVDTIPSYHEYIRSYPQGHHIKAARNAILRIRDDDAWRYAKNTNTIETIRRYLEEYGESARHANEAKMAISELKSGNKGWIIAMALIFICIFIAWFVIKYSGNIQPTPSAPQHQSSGPVIKNSTEINQLKAEIEERLSVKESVFKNGDSPGELGPIQSKIDRLRQYQDPSAESFQKRLDRLRR